MTTLKDIARETKVSVATVSYVLGGKYKTLGVTEKQAENVRNAASRLGYSRNDSARTLVSGKSQTVAFIIPELPLRESSANLINGIMRSVNETGYNFRLIQIPDGANTAAAVGICAGYCVHSVIAYNLEKRLDMTELHSRLAERKIAFATVCGLHSAPEIFHAQPDNLMGGRLLFEHLFQLGHRKFILINDYCRKDWIRDLLTGFMTAAAKVALSDNAVKTVDYEGKADFSLAEVRNFIAGDARALVTWYDDVALRLIGMLIHLGFKIPDDFSVTGYGNESYAAGAFPSITSVEESLNEVGYRTASALIAGAPLQNLLIPVKLHHRDSTAAFNPASIGGAARIFISKS